MVNMNICKNKIVKNIKDSNGNIIIRIYVILSGCKVFDYITFGLSRNIGKSIVLVRPGWSYLFIFVNTLLKKQEVLKYMGEVMICRGGSGSGGSHGSNKELVTLTFVESMNWMVPENIVNNEVSVRLFGGGGGGGMNDWTKYRGNFCGGGGGAGWMNNDIVTVYSGEVIPIIIGAGGIGGNIYSFGGESFDKTNNDGKSGGTTSFGGYLYASGGGGGNMYCGGNGSVGGFGGSGYLWSGLSFQFGGTASNVKGYNANNMAAGGPWGGGGSISSDSYIYSYNSSNCGSGGTYGGGGGSHNRIGLNAYGGNGGTYGGGGGSIASSWNANALIIGGNGGTYGGGGGSLINKHSIGGAYGGNGGCVVNNVLPKNGTNTVGWTNVAIDEESNTYLTGNGIKGSSNAGGGGGYGGNGGKGTNSAGGGGGGYGGDGGIGRTITWNSGWYYGAGGGGGYGSNGGYNGGGGGGYGINADGGHDFGGGGGYYSCGGSYGGTGGGYYTHGRGTNNDISPSSYYKGIGGTGYRYDGINYSFGGNGWFTGNSTNTLYSAEDGNSGICIVRYYRWV